MKILTTPRMERCIGCHACSLACARLVHIRLSWDTAGIRILSSGAKVAVLSWKKVCVFDAAPATRPVRWTPSISILQASRSCVSIVVVVFRSARTTALK